MFQNMAMNLAVALLQKALCMFLGICLDECPDGVCPESDLIDTGKSIDNLTASVPEVSADPTKAQAFNFADSDWSRLPKVLLLIRELIAEVRCMISGSCDDEPTVK